MLNGHSVVLGQRVDPMKLKLAKEFRRKMTPAERKLWKAVRRDQIDGFHFRRQQVIDGFIVDFYCDSARLVVEVDGEVHAFKTAGDRLRDQILKSNGLRVLRVTNEAVLTNLPRVVAKIATMCKRRS
jgi:very-short-patch-repair endonuclease